MIHTSCDRGGVIHVWACLSLLSLLIPYNYPVKFGIKIMPLSNLMNKGICLIINVEYTIFMCKGIGERSVS